MSDIEWMRRLYGELDPLTEPWLAQPDDLIGGWCVTMTAVPGTPADGNPPIANFITEGIATHIAALHNVALKQDQTGEATPWNSATTGM